MVNFQESRARSLPVRNILTSVALLFSFGFLLALLFGRGDESGSIGGNGKVEELSYRESSLKVVPDAEARKVLVESLNLFRDILASVAAQDDPSSISMKKKLPNRALADAFSGIISGIGDSIASGASGATMYLGAGIGNGTINAIGIPPSMLRKNNVLPPPTGINAAAQALGQGLSSSIVGSINISSLLPAGISGDTINTAVLSLAQGLGGGAATGLDLKPTNNMTFANQTGITGIAGNFGQGLSQSFVSRINLQSLVAGFGGNKLSTVDTNAAALTLAQGLGGGAASSLKLVATPANINMFSTTSGISGITGNLGLGLSTSFLTGVDIKSALAMVGGNMTLTGPQINSAALALAQGLGGGAATGLNLKAAVPAFNTDGINGIAGNVGQGLSQSFLQNVSLAQVTSQLGVGGVSLTPPQINSAVLALAQGLGSGAASALKLSNVPANGTSAPFNTDGINGVTGNLGQGLSTSFLQDANLSSLVGNGPSISPAVIAAGAEGLGAGLGQGTVIGLGLQPALAYPATDAMVNTTNANGQVKMVVQNFGRGLISSVLANGTAFKVAALFAAATGNTTSKAASSFSVLKVAQGFGIGLVDGAQTSLQQAGGLSAITGGAPSPPNSYLLAMPPSSSFNDGVGGAATGFGAGLGGESIKGLIAAFGKSSGTAVPASTEPNSGMTMAATEQTMAMPMKQFEGTTKPLAIRPVSKRTNTVVSISKRQAAQVPMGNMNKSTADVINPFLQKGVDVLGCQGIGGLVAIGLSVVPLNKLTSLANSPDGASNFTAALGSVGNATYNFTINGNTFELNLAAKYVKINGSGIVRFAGLLAAHVIFAAIGFWFALPLVLMLNSGRHLAVIAGRPQFLATGPKWQIIIGGAVFVPSAIITLATGVAGEGARNHFYSAHGILGLILFILMFPAVGLWQMRQRLVVPNIVSMGLFLLITFLVIMSGFVDLSQITACVLLFVPQAIFVVTGFLLTAPMVIAVTMVAIHMGIEGLISQNGLQQGRRNKEGKGRVMVIGRPTLVKQSPY